MATYWENSCSFGLRYVSWYKYLIVSLVFSHLGFWSGNLFLIAPFPDLCLLVPFHIESDSPGACNLISSQPNPDLDISNLSDSHELIHSPEVPLVSSPEREQSLDSFVFQDTTDDYNSPDYCGNCFIRKADLKRCTGCSFVQYCSKDCQVEHWGSHKVLCRAIKGLQKPE